MTTMKPKPNMPTDEGCLNEAQGAYGCHATTHAKEVICKRLVTHGLVYEGPFRGMGGHPVYFGIQRHWRQI
jgi:hypothetical protein